MFILAQITQVDLSTLAPAALSTSIELAGNSENILTSSKAVAFMVIAFYFLFLERQTETSRFQKLLMLQHLDSKQFIVPENAILVLIDKMLPSLGEDCVTSPKKGCVGG